MYNSKNAQPDTVKSLVISGNIFYYLPETIINFHITGVSKIFIASTSRHKIIYVKMLLLPTLADRSMTKPKLYNVQENQRLICKRREFILAYSTAKYVNMVTVEISFFYIISNMMKCCPSI